MFQPFFSFFRSGKCDVFEVVGLGEGRLLSGTLITPIKLPQEALEWQSVKPPSPLLEREWLLSTEIRALAVRVPNVCGSPGPNSDEL